VVASINPIQRLALSLAVRPPALLELKAALTVLGDATVGPGLRLEVQILALYQTTCAECHAPTTADSYEWDAELGQPLEKHYVCLNCGGPRDAPTDEADRALAARYGRVGPDFYFLVGRTAVLSEPGPERVEDLLAVYPPRALAAIATVLHKLEALELDGEARRLLSGLLVAAFDASTALAQERPKVLSIPRRYREVNFWRALEGGLGLLAGPPAPDRATTLDRLLADPNQPVIYPHAGSLRDLAERLPPASCALILTAPPRPNQAFGRPGSGAAKRRKPSRLRSIAGATTGPGMRAPSTSLLRRRGELWPMTAAWCASWPKPSPASAPACSRLPPALVLPCRAGRCARIQARPSSSSRRPNRRVARRPPPS